MPFYSSAWCAVPAHFRQPSHNQIGLGIVAFRFDLARFSVNRVIVPDRLGGAG